MTNTSAILNHRRIYVAFLVLVSTCEQSSCSELSAALALLDGKTNMEQSVFFPAAAALHFVFVDCFGFTALPRCPVFNPVPFFFFCSRSLAGQVFGSKLAFLIFHKCCKH